MESNILILALIVGLVAVALLYAWRRRTAGLDGKNEGLLMLESRLNDLARVFTSELRGLDNRLTDSSRFVHDSVKTQFGESQKLVNKFLGELTQMTEKVTRVEETGRQMVSFASELQSLQEMLKNPKQRGILGEYYLETLLKNVLPVGHFQMQYAFHNGEIVDAVVFVKDKVIPIDSKFSLENYNRLVEEKNPAEKEKLEKNFLNDLKNRIVETAKYIRPAENTMDFAFMFIPHEAIYYDLLVNKIGLITNDTENLIQRAAGKYKVIIVSPTSFLAYLQTVLQGLKAMQIEEQAKDIVKRVEELGRHLAAYDSYLASLGGSLATTVNHYNKATREFKKIDKDVMRVSGQTATSSSLNLIEKPLTDE